MLATSFLLFSCGDDDDDDNNDDNDSSGTGTMTATVDGSSWEADLAVQATNSSDVLSIAGTSGDGQINITLGTYDGSGTYPFGDITAAANIAVWTAGANANEVYTTGPGIGSGTIEITDSGDEVSGTFSFEATNANTMTSVSVTNGSFDVEF